MTPERIPLVVLAGSDRKPVRLPRSGEGAHPLSGYKAIDVRLRGKPLIELVIDAAAEAGTFAPIYVAGPARTYGAYADRVTLVDTNSTFAENIRAGVEATEDDGHRGAVAFLTSDIVPDGTLLRRLVEAYRDDAPCGLWFPMIESPLERDELAASAWKPRYRIVPERGEDPVGILPGHFAIARPDAFRLEFAYRLIDLGYGTRNRSIATRRAIMIRRLFGAVIGEDVDALAALRPPTFVASVLTSILPTARKLASGTIVREELERALARLFLTRAFVKRYRERAVRTPIVDALAIALDIDTREEAMQAEDNYGAAEPEDRPISG